MKEYNVFWKEELIGKLYVDEASYKYVADTDKINSMKNSRDWGDEIPYFKIRIDANKNFENLEIGFQTDFMTMRKVK